MSISSIHIGNSSISAVIHNERFFSVDYAIDDDKKNEYLTLDNTALNMRLAKLDYESTRKKKLPKNTELVKEAIVNLNENHSIDDLKKISDYLANDFGYKICHLAIHKDEGHIENERKIFNYHAHILMINYDFKNHRTIRPTPGQMRKIQTDVAKLLEMSRGKEYINPEKATGERLIRYQSNPKNFITERKKRLGIWEYKRMAAEHATKTKELIFQNENLKEKSKLSNFAATNFAKEIGILLQTDQKMYTAKSLMPHIGAKFEKLKKTSESTKAELEQYNFRAFQQRITALQALDVEQKKELHRLNSAVKNNQATVEELERKIKEQTIEKSDIKNQLVNALRTNEEQKKEIERIESLRSTERAAQNAILQETNANALKNQKELEATIGIQKNSLDALGTLESVLQPISKKGITENEFRRRITEFAQQAKRTDDQATRTDKLCSQVTAFTARTDYHAIERTHARRSFRNDIQEGFKRISHIVDFITREITKTISELIAPKQFPPLFSQGKSLFPPEKGLFEEEDGMSWFKP